MEQQTQSVFQRCRSRWLPATQQDLADAEARIIQAILDREKFETALRNLRLSSDELRKSLAEAKKEKL